MLYLADSGNHRLIAVDFTAAATPGTTAAHAVTVADATVLADLTAPSALAVKRELGLGQGIAGMGVVV